MLTWAHGSQAHTPMVGGQSAVRTVELDKEMGDAGLERCSELVQPGFFIHGFRSIVQPVVVLGAGVWRTTLAGVAGACVWGVQPPPRAR